MGHIRTEPGVWGLLESGVCLVCYHPEYDVHSTASSSLALECHFVKLSPCHLAAIWATGTLVVPCSDVHFVWYLHLTYLSNITVSSIPESNKGLDDWIHMRGYLQRISGYQLHFLRSIGHNMICLDTRNNVQSRSLHHVRVRANYNCAAASV